eukprot:1177679-Prorocentrum_minimum.AAC.5
MDQSDVGSAGIFSRRTNHRVVTVLPGHEGPQVSREGGGGAAAIGDRGGPEGVKRGSRQVPPIAGSLRQVVAAGVDSPGEGVDLPSRG